MKSLIRVCVNRWCDNALRLAIALGGLGLVITWQALCVTQAQAQSVGIPLPRLLNMTPMGGQVGTTVEVNLTGEHLEETNELLFSQPGLTAELKRDAAGNIEPNKYLIKIDAACPTGIHQARIMSRLGISSSRVFVVDALPEVTRTAANTTLATAMELKLDSICNANVSSKSIDHYRFAASRGQRIVVHCASRGIDSKLDAVLIVGDAQGRDLQVERRGGLLDFVVPADGSYTIKVHDLTFNGGPAYFYRLSLRQLSPHAALPEYASTKLVSSFSWPPPGLPAQATISEIEPNNNSGPNAGANNSVVQKITLPCDISGSFFPAADVDTFEFAAKKGDVWWVEVASERLGRPTDPAIVVQQQKPDSNEFVDLTELSDIASPVKVSSNGYAYDGPPFNGGSTDILGKLEIKQDGIHRLQLTDLFGGTRKDLRNVYRLVIRQAQPDFALVAWGLHMELRNGDRAALSKPIALRAGQTMALEVVTVRRDGFDGPIELSMDGLPPGVTAQGVTIPAGKTRGIMLVTANEQAKLAFSNATFVGKATIGGQAVSRPCQLAEMSWPVPDSWGEIPTPRLVSGIPVSVSESELAPLSITPTEKKVFEVAAGQKLTVPLTFKHRSEFSGSVIQLRTFGDGFERHPQFNVPVTADTAETTFDTAALKIAPGQYVIAFYGGAVARYQFNPAALALAQSAQQKAEQAVAVAQAEFDRLSKELAAAASEKQAELQLQLKTAETNLTAAKDALKTANDEVKAASERAAPRDTVDIVVSEPITIRVN